MRNFKKTLAILSTLAMAGTMLAGCSSSGSSNETTAAAGGDSADTAAADTTAAAEGGDAAAATGEEGKVFNIYAWNEEFKGFFEKYYTVPEGITVNWIINPSDGGVYQDKLDEALLAQADAAADDKIDMFLAEADYIKKYTDTDATLDVTSIGVAKADTMYQYTIDAASDANGVMKGVSFQCCPAALIYRRSIAKDVLGTDDPNEVQAALSDWSKFESVAATAKEKGYYMTASYAETYRTWSNNATEAWVDANNNLVFPQAMKDYVAQAKSFMDNGYTLSAGIWDDEKTAQMFADGKTMCFFGPAWYYNFCMGNAQDPDKGCMGDWAICEGPQAYFWGGTWLLAATGTDNATMVADIMNTFTTNEEVCTKLVKDDSQFSNNKKVNEEIASDPNYGNEFLGGQNDTAVFVAMADNIKFENKTKYDQLLNENITTIFLDYFKGTISEDEAYNNFYKYVSEKYPAITVPAE